MKKWVLTVLLAVLMITSPQFADAKQFSDVPVTSSYNEVLDELSDEGIITGYSDGTFKPTATISRAHMAVIISRAFDLEEVRPATTFTDVPKSHRYYSEIMGLYTAGVLDGSNGKFNPDAQLTRGQTAKILANILALEELTTTDFTDVPTNHNFNGYIGALVEQGVVKGYEDATFRPNVAVSRQNFAMFIYRAYYPATDEDIDEDLGEGDGLPVIELGTDEIVQYLEDKRSTETELGVFYASPAISDEFLQAYADAFTYEEVGDFQRILSAVLDRKPVFIVIDADEDYEEFAQYTDLEGLYDAMGWVSYEENMIVLSTYSQEDKEHVDRGLLGHEYFHWALSNLYEVEFTTVWVEEALAENMGYAMQDNVVRFTETNKFAEYIEELLAQDELGDMTEHYSMESVVAWALIEQEYGIEAIEQFIQSLPDYETDDEAFEALFDMTYEDLEQVVLDYLELQAS